MKRVLFLLTSVTFILTLADYRKIAAQELKKTRADYHSGSVQYSPDDPWTRSKVFQAHTGHSGFFYNCDNEECKRYSPYISWEQNCQPLWPERIRLFESLRTDLDKIRWRVNAGGCGCEYCLKSPDCQTCQSADRCHECKHCNNSKISAKLQGDRLDSKNRPAVAHVPPGALDEKSHRADRLPSGKGNFFR
jgi:hypothetical protein